MRSAFVQTASGRYLDVQDPQPDDIDIADIAHHLAHLCRFGGACRQYYSEAEHAVRMAEILPPRLKLAGLLYGAAKAYAGEAVRPGGQAGPAPQHRLTAAVEARFGLHLSGDDRAELAMADACLLATERRDLMPPDNIEWPILTGVQPLAERIWPMTIAQALASFCAVYEQCRAWSSSAQIRLRQPSVR
ncbi:phosphohydrolase [Chromobacterium violaceum]|uniref:phosphohydrolase n=1 Tax=Chromobacterium violaceum TaxID=536 RepID=UPI0009DAC465|nr:phosphohydrolase [Chromobacterium violaceum]OQS46343.1 phosphohydrolase [Chromobacterium violaceum]OQS48786.1 phosphohydrolase [Chromobacterium violaceum]QRO32200.1 phosphohydrolase [Chromobacterium violaceum]QRQ17999.1 phosphohydrolase [Chromobacterium violaceum]